MTQITAESGGTQAETDELTESEPYELLAAPERRIVLELLSERDAPVELSDLSEVVAARVTDGEQSVRVGLHHCHLPKLADYGFIRYDPSVKRVEAAQIPPRILQ